MPFRSKCVKVESGEIVKAEAEMSDPVSNAEIEDVLSSHLYSSVEKHKLVIPGALVTGIFALLRKMNITSKSLYGDLDGLARSVRMQMQIYAV